MPGNHPGLALFQKYPAPAPADGFHRRADAQHFVNAAANVLYGKKQLFHRA